MATQQPGAVVVQGSLGASQSSYSKPEVIQMISGQPIDPNAPPLVYSIHGRPAFTYGDVILDGSRKVLADGKAMLWMDSHLQVGTECYGGCGASCMRSCSGESCCMNTYSGAGKVTVGFDDPGDMLAFGVTRGHGWMITQSAFVAGSENIKVSGKFSGCCVCCCTDEGVFMTTVEISEDSKEDNGIFLAGSYGMLERHELPEGKSMYVARGSFFAGHSDRPLNVTMVGGCCNFCCGASWRSIVFKFEGPCVVYTQSRNPQDLRRLQEIAKASKAGGDERGQDDNSGGGFGGD